MISIYKNTNNILKNKKNKEQARQIREEKRQVVKSHLLSLMDIKHEQHVPIKQAFAKYKADLNANYTDRSIKQSIEYGIGDILMIQKIKNRWVCSKERL